MRLHLLSKRVLWYGLPTRIVHRQTDTVRWSTHQKISARLNLLTRQSQAAVYFSSIPQRPCNTNYFLRQQGIANTQISCPYIPRLFSSNVPDKKKPDETEQNIGIFQRFKKAYKEYGKVLVGVHCATSAVWFGMFYYAALKGIDVVPLLQKIGASETVIKPFQSGAGDFAVMYLLYKLATPARYTVTIVGTQYTVKVLRRLGYMEPVPEGDSIRDLMKEGRQQVKEKVDDRKEKLKDRADEMKEKYEARKDTVKEKIAERKEKMKDVKEKLEDQSEKLKDKAQDLSGQIDKEKIKYAVTDTAKRVKETAHEMKQTLDKDENVQEMKKKLGNTAEKVKDSAYDFKQKLEKGETARDIKKNLDKAKYQVKDTAHDLKKKIQKKK